MSGGNLSFGAIRASGRARRRPLTMRQSTCGYLSASSRTTAFICSHGSAQLAQKFKSDTRFRSADMSVVKCSGDVTVTTFEGEDVPLVPLPLPLAEAAAAAEDAIVKRLPRAYLRSPRDELNQCRVRSSPIR